MKILLCIAAVIACYLLGGINPSIILSNKLYNKDIRLFGSHNPGFTNFLRNFGDSAWLVFCIDIAKGLLLAWLTGLLFRLLLGLQQLGAAFACLFAMIGHSYPIWYGFRGGKGAAVFAGAIWFIDWRAGIVALIIFLNFLILKRYMSLAVICASVSFSAALAVIGVEHGLVLLLTSLSALLIIIRHIENIRRLSNGTESIFTLKKP